MFQSSNSSNSRRAITVLSDALPAAGLTPKDIAADIGISTASLANWRAKGVGPPYLKLGKKIRYPQRDYVAWRESTRVRTIAKTGKAA